MGWLANWTKGITVPKVILRRQVGIGPTHLPLSLDLRLDSMRTFVPLPLLSPQL